MDGAILTFPLRAGLAVTRMTLRVAGDVAGFTLKLGGRTVVAATEAAARAASRAGDDVVAAPTQAPDVEARVVEPEVSLPEPEVPLPEPDAPLVDPEVSQPEVPLVDPEARWDTEPDPEPLHVSEEPELVEEVAEPGAEEGAGASVEIAEPWPGYRALTAADVIARIETATPAELAGIELYESAHRNRQTVMDAAQRTLKTKTGRGSPDRRE